MSGSASALLAAEDLHYRYPDGTAALRGVTLSVSAGEIVAVLGPSGAGKSTLFQCLAGLRPPGSGAVLLDGVEHSALRGRARRRAAARIGLVFQEFQIVGRASVLSNVLIGRLVGCHPLTSLAHLTTRADREIAVEMIGRVGLLPQVRKRADALSGGQRQRVAVARALAQRPEILLADEPVANLDPTLAAAVVDDIVGQVREQHLTAVLNLHDVGLARRVAQRLIGMRDGAVLFDRPAEQVSDDDLALLYGGELSAPVLEPAG